MTAPVQHWSARSSPGKCSLALAASCQSLS